MVQRLYKACHVAKLGANRGHLSYAHVVDTRFINWGTCSSSVGGSGESTDSDPELEKFESRGYSYVLNLVQLY